MSRLFLTLIQVLMASLFAESVVGYENAYDLFERRNHRHFHEPSSRNFHTSETFSFNDRNRYHPPNRNSFSVYTTRPYFSKFGNGYDNLGNGIPSGRFYPFHREMTTYRNDWRYDQRPIHRNNFGFDDYTFTRGTQRRPYSSYHSREYYPKYGENTGSINRMYGNEYGTRDHSGVSKVDLFIEDNEDKKQKKTDEIFQESQEGVTMDSVRKETAGEQSHTDQSGENKSRLRSNKVVKKGHTTRGFASHHHKDETGNSTTFFDESSDFGGQSDLRDIADGFNTRKTLEQISNVGNEKFFRENGGQTGNYGTGLQIGNQRFAKNFSTKGGHRETGGAFQNAKQNENNGNPKTFQYLNGDSFDYSEPHTDTYYLEYET